MKALDQAPAARSRLQAGIDRMNQRIAELDLAIYDGDSLREGVSIIQINQALAEQQALLDKVAKWMLAEHEALLALHFDPSDHENC